MNSVFAQLALSDVHGDVARNIVSLRQSQNLFDDLTGDPAEWLLAQKVEYEVKPPPYRSRTPIVDRPFEDAEWFDAIDWPFKNWQTSRFSDGTYGVWCGSESIETTVHESACHWYQGLLSDAGFERMTVVAERKVYLVHYNAALLDFRKVINGYPDLLHPSDYAFCQSIGARIHREGHPGLLARSVRRSVGQNTVIFNPAVLSSPRHNCQVTYRLEGGRIVVGKGSDATWLILDAANLL